MKKFFLSLLAIILIVTAITCKKTNSASPNNSNNNSTDTSKPQPTGVGTLTGTPVSQVIGSSGGSITSTDGSAELVIPAGALSANTTITLQPITNTCPAGIVSAFRFSPNGLHFNQPATLIFHYPDSVLKNTIPGLMGIAVQDSNGYWKVANKVNNDTIAHTISASIVHFTDYSPMDLINLHPLSPAVNPGKTDALFIEIFSLQDFAETGVPFQSGGDNNDIFQKYLEHYKGPIIWTVNGITNGNSQYGTIGPAQYLANYKTVADFTAPSTVPAKNNPVTISAAISMTLAYNDQNFNKIIIYTHILIVDAQYLVQLYFEADSVNESGAYWNITDSALFSVYTNSNRQGVMDKPVNYDATETLLYNDGTCTVTRGPSAQGPLHVLDSGTVAIDPVNKNITIVFNNALNPAYYVLFPSWKYICGADQGTLGGGLGPPFPNYLQFGMMDIPETVETIILTPQYKMVVTRY
jgi:hypothetical protein